MTGGGAPEFDRYRDSYVDALDHAVGFSGRDPLFFARAKADLLVDLGGRLVGDPATLSLLDVGCGVGLVDAFLCGRFGAVHGTDVSAEMVAAARERNPYVEYAVARSGELPYATGAFDLAFAACVLHHVPPGERVALIREIARVLRPGGLGVVVEHNPFNPLTRVVVSRCEFDEDIELLRRSEAERLVAEGGLARVETRYVVFFPWRSRPLARIERALGWLPAGAQYYVSARRG